MRLAGSVLATHWDTISRERASPRPTCHRQCVPRHGVVTFGDLAALDAAPQQLVQCAAASRHFHYVLAHVRGALGEAGQGPHCLTRHPYASALQHLSPCDESAVAVRLTSGCGIQCTVSQVTEIEPPSRHAITHRQLQGRPNDLVCLRLAAAQVVSAFPATLQHIASHLKPLIATMRCGEQAQQW